ncbi:MAG: molybdopterin-dependent oxidoreductase, partial [Calditrichia bacterium]
CIQCYRCVRFYREYAGGRDLNVFAAHNHVYFGRHEDGTLENEFSGNLVEVCPTGVFTDKTLKQHYTRKWDLTMAPSVCHLCSLGCNIIPAERYGKLRRIMSRYNGEVNGYFICDRGRFGYEFVNSEKRIRQPLRRIQSGTGFEPISTEDLLKEMAGLFKNGRKLIGIGSPTASLESNFLLRELVGAENFYPGVSEKDYLLMNTVLEILKEGPARTPSLREIEKADTVLVLGEDVTNTAPMLALALRQAARQVQVDIAAKFNIPGWHDAAVREAAQETHGPLFIAAGHETKLDEIANVVWHDAPPDLARLGFAIAHALDSARPPVTDLSDETGKIAEEIAAALKSAKNPLIVSGTGTGSPELLHAAADISRALHGNGVQAQISLVIPEANSLGLAMMGGNSLSAALERLEKGDADTAIVLENDLYRRLEKPMVDRFIEKCNQLITLNSLQNRTTEQAGFVLPSGTFAESDGTLVNNEGRAQRFYQVFVPEGEVRESWRWLRELMSVSGSERGEVWHNPDTILAVLEEALPQFKGIRGIAPPPGFRIAGQKIPREPHRYSGRTAMHANENVHEAKPPDDPDTPLSFTMEGYRGQPPASLIPFFWSPGWNSVQSVNKYQIEVGGPLHGGDPGLRLIEPRTQEKIAYENRIPVPFSARENEWLIFPGYRIFGSEPLSLLTPAVAQRKPESFLLMNRKEAESRGLKETDRIRLRAREAEIELTLQTGDDIPRGTAGVSYGFPELPFLDLPTFATIQKVSQ